MSQRSRSERLGVPAAPSLRGCGGEWDQGADVLSQRPPAARARAPRCGQTLGRDSGQQGRGGEGGKMTVCLLLSGMGPPVFHLCTPVPGGPSCPQVHPGHLPSLIAQLRSLLFLALGSGQGPSPPGSEPPPCRGTNLWSFCLPLTQKPRGHFPKEIQLLLLLGGAECLRPSQIRALKLHVQAGGVRPCGLQKVVGSWGLSCMGLEPL